MCRNFFMMIAIAAILAFAMPAFSQEEVQYKKFKLDDVSCDVGVRYNKVADGMEIGVSAIAYGKGAEFRKWEVSDIKLVLGKEKLRANTTAKFYVKKESLFRVPAAVLFAILGTQVDVGGSDLQQGIGKAGMAIGLGLLVMQAQGEITGEKYVFKIDKDMEKKIIDGWDSFEITIANDDLHEKQSLRVGIVRSIDRARVEASLGGMAKDGLKSLIDKQEAEIAELEKAQGSYRYGVDARYDEIQSKIEHLQAERGIAYKVWFEKKQ